MWKIAVTCDTLRTGIRLPLCVKSGHYHHIDLAIQSRKRTGDGYTQYN